MLNAQCSMPESQHSSLNDRRRPVRDARTSRGGVRWSLSIVHWALCVVLVSPSPAAAWGFEAHKFIMDRAIALLPADLRPIFERHRAVVVERSIDPDTWIIVGRFDEEAPHHFLDIDAYRKYPFRELPRDYAAAVKKFGERRVQRDGTLPWRAQELLRPPADGVRDHASTWWRQRRARRHPDCRRPGSLCVGLGPAIPCRRQLRRPADAAAGDSFPRSRRRCSSASARSCAIAPSPIAPVRDMTGAIFDTLIEGTRLVPRHSRGRPRRSRRPTGVRRCLLHDVLPRRKTRSGAAAERIDRARGGQYQRGVEISRAVVPCALASRPENHEGRFATHTMLHEA